MLFRALPEGPVPMRPRLKTMVMVSHAVRCLDFRAIRGSIVVLVHDLLFTELIALSVDPGTQVARRPPVAIPVYIGRG